MNSSSREPFSPVLATDADVTTMWRTIINPLGWHTWRVYFMLVDPDGHPHPQLVEVDEMPETFDSEDAVRFVEFLSMLADDLGGDSCSVALMFARPGDGGLSDGDRALCCELYAAAKDAGLRLELLHVATDTAITPAPMDEVLPRTA
ncbi:hypothetical protein D0Z08_15665 [Nocardioides immobilis]|uniref:DUF4192 family protein n=1 Tax=Nocardioides immobilis TaxID=2049295 RepID=A0A417Y0D0_9ACTN|nr:hypothetical protein [Nocardioides immobilis]RHW26083.1 hypothetical protein D0Z08_15665 [Nocardioides immobilis]